MTRVLVTGATGFVGRALCPALIAAGWRVSASSRNPRSLEDVHGVDIRPTFGLGAGADWSGALAGNEAVVHLAARVHVMNDPSTDPLAEHRRTNTEGTRALAVEAAEAGVRRFVFLSTVKVLGETSGEGAFQDDTLPAPRDPYAISKLEAEQALAEVAAATGMEVVILRPPLVYGPGVKGNFLSLLRLAARGWPLPLAGIRNRRSLVYVDNLADAIVRCLSHPRAAGRRFLVRDGEDLSTAELYRAVAAALGRPARLFPVPGALFRSLARIAGRGEAAGRLLDSLAVDDRQIRSELGWSPPSTLDHGIAETAAWFLAGSG